MKYTLLLLLTLAILVTQTNCGKTKKGCAFRGKNYDVGDQVQIWGCPNCECSENGEVACKGRSRYCKMARARQDSVTHVKRGAATTPMYNTPSRRAATTPMYNTPSRRAATTPVYNTPSRGAATTPFNTSPSASGRFNRVKRWITTSPYYYTTQLGNPFSVPQEE